MREFHHLTCHMFHCYHFWEPVLPFVQGVILLPCCPAKQHHLHLEEEVHRQNSRLGTHDPVPSREGMSMSNFWSNPNPNPRFCKTCRLHPLAGRSPHQHRTGGQVSLNKPGLIPKMVAPRTSPYQLVAINNNGTVTTQKNDVVQQTVNTRRAQPHDT